MGLVLYEKVCCHEPCARQAKQLLLSFLVNNAYGNIA